MLDVLIRVNYAEYLTVSNNHDSKRRPLTNSKKGEKGAHLCFIGDISLYLDLTALESEESR